MRWTRRLTLGAALLVSLGGVGPEANPLGSFSLGGATPLAAAPIRVRGDRWLEVRRALGQVTYRRGRVTQPAQKGSRLSAIGDELSTGNRSSSILAIDTDISFLKVAERTRLRVQRLSIHADGGRMTQLYVQRGRVRLQVRPFTHPSSKLELHTPAGIVGVRGTDFGTRVKTSGETQIAVHEGSVAVTAQGRTVIINAGFQGTIFPGSPPSSPTPLASQPVIDIQRLAAVKNQQVRIAGQIDPTHQLQIGDTVLPVDSNGQFDATLPLPDKRQLTVTVTTISGEQQRYDLIIP